MTEADEQGATIGRADTLGPEAATDDRTDLDDELLRAQVKARMFGRSEQVKIGRYELTGRLGHGGMGVVYAAVDRELERKIAIKLLLPGRPAGVDRLVREARALARLAHPNVVTVHEVGTHEGQVFVAMEFVEGPTLRQWLAEPRSLGETLAVFVQAARGLHAAHAAGLVHRDFKPDNVTVGIDGRVRVLDFGLAKRTELDELDEAPPADEARIAVTHALTQTGQLVGTPAYMAPEQILGRSVDGRADVFAFCVALFEALEHRRPFPGEDVIALHRAMLDKPPRPPTPPPKLGAAIEAGLSYDPGPRSLERLIGALEQALVPDDARGKILKATAAAIVVSTAIGGLIGLFRGADPPTEPPPPPPAIPAVPPIPAVLAAVPATGANDTVAQWLDSPMCTPYEPQRGRVHGTDDTTVATRARAALDDGGRDYPCGLLRNHFDGDEPIDDDARCLYAQFCKDTVACPERTTEIGSAGCVVTDTCHAELGATKPACERGELACCDRLADEELTAAQQATARGDRDAAASLSSHARDVETLLCDAGIDAACMKAARLAHEASDRSAEARMLAIACGHGHVQACRRVARVGETNPDPGTQRWAIRCALESSPQCPIAHPDAAVLVRRAECGAIATEHPQGTLVGGVDEVFAAYDPPDVTADEAAALQRAATRYRDDVYTELQAIARAAGVPVQGDREALHLAITGSLDVHRRRDRIGALHRTIADERAGFAEPPSDLRALDPLEQWVRLDVDYGERLHRALAAELGDARADALHRLHGNWRGASGLLRLYGPCPEAR